MRSNIFTIIVCVISIAFFSDCKENSSEPDPKNAQIYGTVSFHDGTPASYATLDLKTLPINNHRTAVADAGGNYSFEDLFGADYILKFIGGSEINPYEAEIELGQGKEHIENITLTINVLEETFGKNINSDVAIIMYEPNSARIGNNYHLVDYLSGSYNSDFGSTVTLSADVYLIPSSMNWQDQDFDISADSIRNNFIFIMSYEESYDYGTHTIRIEGDDIRKILSNPENGFALVKRGNQDKELKIPCVDRANNNFGLKIYYKDF
ncbi:MAG: carboxypeptidase regulatory-like domain-containing protein [Melioribacteraceae bacterium]|nr:carboxypeptidase regulatory-like domain-containing protein [Melioribacteraceae bacterium]